MDGIQLCQEMRRLLREILRTRPSQVPRPAQGLKQLRYLLVDMLRIAEGAFAL